MVNAVEPSPRAQIELACTLRRGAGSPIPTQTLVLGPRGMQVRSPRPLALDETLGFELSDLYMRVCGRARVLRQERSNVYALRFEGLSGQMTRCLHELAVEASAARRD